MTQLAESLKSYAERINQLQSILTKINTCSVNFDQIDPIFGKSSQDLLDEFHNFIDDKLTQTIQDLQQLEPLENNINDLWRLCQIGVYPQTINNPHSLIENSDIETIGRLCSSNRYFANLCKNDPTIRNVIQRKILESEKGQIRMRNAEIRRKTGELLRSINYDPSLARSYALNHPDLEIRQDLIRRGYSS